MVHVGNSTAKRDGQEFSKEEKRYNWEMQRKDVIVLSGDNKRVFYLEGGRERKIRQIIYNVLII